MARSCWYSARLRKKPSMGRGMPGRATAAPRCRTPPLIVSNAFGGMMWTCSAWTSAPSCACSTGMGVCRRSNSGRWLTWVGSRCGITTKPRPLWAGMALKNLFNASSPPAEAPIATTGKSLGWPSPASSASVDASAAGRGAGVPPSDSKRLADGFFPCLFAMPEFGSLSYPRGTITSELDVPPECILNMNRDSLPAGSCSPFVRVYRVCAVCQNAETSGIEQRFGPRVGIARGPMQVPEYRINLSQLGEGRAAPRRSTGLFLGRLAALGLYA